MRRLAGAAMAAFLAATLLAGAALADDSQTSENGSVSGQFKEGAHRIGEGAVHIGQGIKQGAIDVWDAAKAGASVAADKFRQATGSGTSTAPDAGTRR